MPPGKREPAPERDSLQTLVGVKCSDRWEFVAFRTPLSADRSKPARHVVLADRRLVLDVACREASQGAGPVSCGHGVTCRRGGGSSGR